MNLDPRVRGALADGVTGCLAAAVPGSRAGLRGSLASGTADALSDIDAWWELPDADFEDAVEALPEILAAVRPLDALRSHPLLQNSSKHRLVFAQFSGVPLYWRVDIEVFAASIAMDSSYDLESRGARGDDWSQAHSALMDGVAAIKCLVRDVPDRATALLENAFERLGLVPPAEPPWDAVQTLSEAAGRLDLEQAVLARRVQVLRREALAHLAARRAAS